MVFQCFRQRHVSNAMTNCGLYQNMPKACPYVMIQFFTPTPIVIDLNYYYKRAEKIWKKENKSLSLQ